MMAPNRRYELSTEFRTPSSIGTRRTSVKGGVKLDHSGGEKVDQFRGGGSFDLRGSCGDGWSGGLRRPQGGAVRPEWKPPSQLVRPVLGEIRREAFRNAFVCCP